MMQQLLHLHHLQPATFPLTEAEWQVLYLELLPWANVKGIFKQYRISVESKGISVIVPMSETILGNWSDGTGRYVLFDERAKVYEVGLYPDGIFSIIKNFGSTPEGTYRNNDGLIVTVTQVENL